MSPEEKRERRAQFRRMGAAEKLDYILSYYKVPLLLGLLALGILFSVVHRAATRKEPVLYLALCNVAVGEDCEQALTTGFLAFDGADERRQEVYLYPGLYLSENAATENHEYAYASRMKLLGALSAQKLDLLLLNREACDLLSQKGYLLPLTELPGAEALAALWAENEVVLSDNALEVMLDESVAPERVTQREANALAVATLPLFREAGFGEEIYLAAAANSPRLEAVSRYLRYLAGEG